MSLLPHTLLQDRYQLIRLIGQGGMGVVYEAIDQRLECTVAIKQIIHGDAQAFGREAQLLARLRHPALPKVTDYFVEEAGQFLVMDYIAGDDLATAQVRRVQPFSTPEVLAWADQLLDALEYLHSRQPPVLHRDIKPANLKLTEEGGVILLDFGLAKGKTGQTLAMEKSTPGYTLCYAAPEQVRGEMTDPRSDLYAVGATIYNLLTGVQPPDALTRTLAKAGGRPDPLQPAFVENPVAPLAISEVVRKAMSLSPEERFASASALRQALRLASALPMTEPAPGAAEGNRPSSRAQATVFPPGKAPAKAASAQVVGANKTNRTGRRVWTGVGAFLIFGAILLFSMSDVGHPIAKWAGWASLDAPDPGAENGNAATGVATTDGMSTFPVTTTQAVPATPDGATAVISPILFFTGDQDCEPATGANQFPTGTTHIVAYFDAGPLRPRPSRLIWVLHYAGIEFDRGESAVGMDGRTCIRLGSAAKPLQNGHYELHLASDIMSLRSDFFSIGEIARRPLESLKFISEPMRGGVAINPRTAFSLSEISTTGGITAVFPFDGLPPGMRPEFVLTAREQEYYGFMNVENTPEGSIFGWRWHHHGRLVNSFDNSPIQHTFYYWLATNRIQSGVYEVTIVLNSAPVQRAQLVISP